MYLIIDNDLCQSIENAARRGVDVKTIVPHVPDKRLILEMTRSYYHRLMGAGVEIYEYAPGFIHAKSYLADDEYAMIGAINSTTAVSFTTSKTACGCTTAKVFRISSGIFSIRCRFLSRLRRRSPRSSCALSDPLSESLRRCCK